MSARRLLLAGRIGPSRHGAIGPERFLLGDELREVSVDILVGGQVFWTSMAVASHAPREHVSWALSEALMDVGRVSGFVTGEEA